MAGRKKRKTFGQHIAQAAKVGVGLAAVAALGYVMLAVLEHDGPILTSASGFVLESRTVDPEPATGVRNASTSTGTATAAVRPTITETAPARDFDYFPDHYRNQAKEPAEPIDTF